MLDVDDQLLEWALKYIPGEVRSSPQPALTAASGDAGFRHYFRLNSEPSLLAVYAPPAQENNLDFVRKAEVLRRHGLRVPVIHAVDFEQGFLLIEDLGTLHCLDLLDDRSFAAVYDLADDVLLNLQGCPADEALFPVYDHALLQMELRLFPEWFLERLLGLPLEGEAKGQFERLEQLLIESALEQPQVLVHRDYHSRNLMVMTDSAARPKALGVIDFQDAVRGPVTYDVVSLYRDCYIRWSEEQVAARAELYLSRAVAAGVMPVVESTQFQRWFDLMGLHRHIKVLGVFARLWLRDGKSRYLADLPLVMRYTLEVARRYETFRDFAVWFEREVVPRAAECAWYRPWQTAGDRIFEDCV